MNSTRTADISYVLEGRLTGQNTFHALSMPVEYRFLPKDPHIYDRHGYVEYRVVEITTVVVVDRKIINRMVAEPSVCPQCGDRRPPIPPMALCEGCNQ